MNYVIAVAKAIFSMAVFVAAASVASSDFQNVVVAGLGLIYVTANIGFADLSHKQGESMIGNLRFFDRILKATSEDEDDLLSLNRIIETAEKKLDQNKIIYGIQDISGIFILLGCASLLFKAVFL